ncbi:MAG: DUF1254 domain-containing protein, partial [Desulfobulbaceae bacterium]|nr:DUF1254 domain-containing protein [Desulfobulbaceae bacterium]
MKNSKLTKSILALVAITALTVPGMVFAQTLTLNYNHQIDPYTERLLYSRAFEAILWASPTLAVYCQAEAGTRDLGAGHLDIVYMGKTPDYRWGGVTTNNQAPAFMSYFSLKDGPVVVEIPGAKPEAKVFGSIHDSWGIPLEDFGPAGADKGKGGK